MAGTNFFTPVNSTLDSALTDQNGYVYYARCSGAAPTTAGVFAHGAIIVQSDSTTGQGAVFQNVGSVASPSWTSLDERSLSTAPITIATTSTSDSYVIAPKAGIVTSIRFSGVDALATSDTNYITFSVTNLGQAGAGSAALLAASDANTTKATGGSALAANTVRSLTLTSTAADLVVAAGDRIRLRATATGTLANTVTFSTYLITIK